ncbi:MAG: NCS2 family permease [Clostridiales bacterium]|jgi:AGZA family xanthine/uracil permease-like MFS transporter|nr:NCS2 family permease [Clostridiales bacterium]
MENFFKLKESGTNARTEVLAGLTTYFAMAYIIFVNPAMLSATGIPRGGVFIATILASLVGTLVMGLFANVPYALAPGMGLNAFFTYTVCFGLGFTWQEALAMVFLCGVINVAITVSRIRKLIIRAIPVSMQHAIGGGIGIFIAYIGIKNANFLSFTSDPGTYAMLGDGAAETTTIVTGSSIVPALATFSAPLVFAFIALALTVVLVILKVPGAIFVGIVASTIIGIPFGAVDLSQARITEGIGQAFAEFGQTFGAAIYQGFPSLFGSGARIPLVLLTIFAFSLSDTFDTIGTFIGTGRRTGIFSDADMRTLETSSGFSSKMDRALFADSIATSVGALLGTSNTTTYVESSAGIGAGGKTGLTSVVTAAMFLASIALAPVIGIIPAQATAPALIIVGVMMMASFAEIKWADIEEAVPAFFAGIFMALCYSISYGIAAGFVFHCIVKTAKGKAGSVHPVVWVSTGLFVLNFVVLALI